MDKKKLIRKSYFLKRKKLYFEINESFFSPLLNLLKRQRNNKKLNISIYFPSFFEVNVLKILNIEYFKKYNFLLPRIEDKNLMNFYKWKKNQILLKHHPRINYEYWKFIRRSWFFKYFS